MLKLIWGFAVWLSFIVLSVKEIEMKFRELFFDDDDNQNAEQS
jgi:hypothetical protein